MTLEQFVSRLKYDRNVPRNRLKSWFMMYFCFRIKILKGNPCAGLLFEIVHTNVVGSKLKAQSLKASSKHLPAHPLDILTFLSVKNNEGEPLG